MKRLNILAFIVVALLLAGCQSEDTVASYINVAATEKLLNKKNEDSELPNTGDIDIFDFAYINQAPRTEESHEVADIIKMYATTWSIDEHHYPIAIDIQNKEIYVESSVRRYGIEFETDRIKADDMDQVLQLFETYDVLNWQNYYSDVKDYHSYEDGASWSLTVQYDDGTIEKFRGEGMSFSDIVPDNYPDFMKELETYVNGYLEN